MKEIKFKVWDNHYERWEKRPCVINKEGILFIYNVDSGEWFEPSHTGYAVKWYIGFKSRNGKEIYEGDIAKTDNDGVGIYEIVWFKMWAGYFRKVIQPSNYEPNGSEIQPLSQNMAKHDIEVIGNIHQNPELKEK